MDLRLSTLLVYIAAYLLVACLAVCIATGVYYVAEVIEENTQKTKALIRSCIQFTAGAHVVLLVWDRQPFLCVLSGCLAQGSYLQLLTKQFPYVSFSSPFAMLSAAALTVNQWAWYSHFSESVETLEYALCFCLVVVWLVPIILMLSIASSDGVLPGAPGMGGSTATPSRAQGQEALYGGQKKGFLLQIFSLLQSHTAPYVRQAFTHLGIRRKASKRDHHM